MLFLGIRILPIEQRRVADRPDAYATALIRDLRAKSCTFVAVSAEEAQFHEFVSAQEALEFGEELRRQTAAPDFESGFEGLSQPAQIRALRARERKVIH